MKAIKCEMCNSTDVVKDGDYYVCQSCGIKYTVEAAKKLMVEGTVKIDTSDNVKKWFDIARRAFKGSDYTTAAKYYDMIMAEDPNNWEAVFYSMYCSSFKIRNEEIQYMASRMCNSMRGIGELVFNIEDKENRDLAIDELTNGAISASQTLSSFSDNFFSKLPLLMGNMDKYINTNTDCCKILINWADVLCEHIQEDDKYRQKAIILYKKSLDIAPVIIRPFINTDKKLADRVTGKEKIIFLRGIAQRVKQLESYQIDNNECCPKCNKALNYNVKFCPSCGTNLKYCPNCNSVNASESKFCRKCGNKL